LFRFHFQLHFWLLPKECSFFLISVETRFESKWFFPITIYGSKKAGWYDLAAPTATLRVAVGFLLREKSRTRRLSLQIRRMNRRI